MDYDCARLSFLMTPHNATIMKTPTKIGFIGLGNVGGKLAGSLLRNGFDLQVRDLERETAAD